LSKNLTGPRNLEPFLEDPHMIADVCPPELHGLLQEFYTYRAFKTACFWGYWGDWRSAADLRSRFCRPGDFRLPYYASSLVCSTPLGAALGSAWRIQAGLWSRLRDILRLRPSEGVPAPVGPTAQEQNSATQRAA